MPQIARYLRIVPRYFDIHRTQLNLLVSTECLRTIDIYRNVPKSSGIERDAPELLVFMEVTRNYRYLPKCHIPFVFYRNASDLL